MHTLIRSNAEVWKQYVRHDFVRHLGEGTLSREGFLHFIKCVVNHPILVSHLCHSSRQDYRFLKDYAIANGYSLARSPHLTQPLKDK